MVGGGLRPEASTSLMMSVMRISAMVAFGVHAEVTLRVHGEVVTSPSFEAVIFFGVFGRPRLRFAHVGREEDF
jgi:hypothetical protein